ncbi:hypothetical protein J6590_035793 [Homalodisca vitripennis]|nr:hypothetical protein J6590_035793 [Homalodisca vitripennis]
MRATPLTGNVEILGVEGRIDKSSLLLNTTVGVGENLIALMSVAGLDIKRRQVIEEQLQSRFNMMPTHSHRSHLCQARRALRQARIPHRAHPD